VGSLIDYPFYFAICVLVVMMAAAFAGAALRRRRTLGAATEGDVTLLVTSALTILGLILGFSFSMAVSRYDLRKEYEENEANAIGTEYLRVELLPSAKAAALESMLAQYTNERIRFYLASDERELAQNDSATAALQKAMWHDVNAYAIVHRDPVTAAIATGMNDAINTQGYTQYAWWNRIPAAAWALMLVFGIICSLLFGFKTALDVGAPYRLVVLPLIISVAFMLIADLDSPRHGFIKLLPQNLEATLQSFTGHQ
jgi:hypothetical protein